VVRAYRPCCREVTLLRYKSRLSTNQAQSATMQMGHVTLFHLHKPPSQRNNVNVNVTSLCSFKNILHDDPQPCTPATCYNSQASSTRKKKEVGSRWQDIDSYLGIFLILILIVSLLLAFVPLVSTPSDAVQIAPGP